MTEQQACHRQIVRSDGYVCSLPLTGCFCGEPPRRRGDEAWGRRRLQQRCALPPHSIRPPSRVTAVSQTMRERTTLQPARQVEGVRRWARTARTAGSS